MDNDQCVRAAAEARARSLAEVRMDKTLGAKQAHTKSAENDGASTCHRQAIRPISLLRLSLLRFVDSKLPENPLWTWEFPLKTKILLESNPLKSRILVRRVAAGATNTYACAAPNTSAARRSTRRAGGAFLSSTRDLGSGCFPSHFDLTAPGHTDTFARSCLS